MVITPRRAVLAASTALLMVTAGCSSTGTVPGREVGSSTATPPRTSVADTATPTPETPAPGTPTSSAPSTADDEPTGDPSTAGVPAPQSTAATGGRTLCAGFTTNDPIAQCLRSTLSDFWSGQLNEVISEPVYLTPAESSVPQECRPGLDAAPAFTCKSDKSLYINQPLLDLIDRYASGKDRFYAFASVQSHEFGHVLQYTLHQPQIESGDSSTANSQFLEQQADCLSGVWAAHAGGGFDRAEFRRVAVELVTLVSSNPEIATHGTPAQRAAAIDRGLASGRPQSCKLVTFS